MDIVVTFLRDVDNGGNKTQPASIAKQLENFIREAQSSLHIAIYDFRLTQQELSDPVITAIKDRSDAGVEGHSWRSR